jgi:hypothetical protein
MLRKVLLVLMAVVISYGLTAFAGYILYASGEGWSEAHLSIVIRFIESPLIAVLIGSLVGFLNKDRPIPTSIIGLAPWTILLLSSPNKRVLSAKLRNQEIVFPARCDSPSVMRNRREERFVPRFPGSSTASTPRA